MLGFIACTALHHGGTHDAGAMYELDMVPFLGINHDDHSPTLKGIGSLFHTWEQRL